LLVRNPGLRSCNGNTIKPCYLIPRECATFLAFIPVAYFHVSPFPLSQPPLQKLVMVEAWTSGGPCTVGSAPPRTRAAFALRFTWQASFAPANTSLPHLLYFLASSDGMAPPLLSSCTKRNLKRQVSGTILLDRQRLSLHPVQRWGNLRKSFLVHDPSWTRAQGWNQPPTINAHLLSCLDWPKPRACAPEPPVPLTDLRVAIHSSRQRRDGRSLATFCDPRSKPTQVKSTHDWQRRPSSSSSCTIHHPITCRGIYTLLSLNVRMMNNELPSPWMTCFFSRATMK